ERREPLARLFPAECRVWCWSWPSCPSIDGCSSQCLRRSMFASPVSIPPRSISEARRRPRKRDRRRQDQADHVDLDCLKSYGREIGCVTRPAALEYAHACLMIGEDPCLRADLDGLLDRRIFHRVDLSRDLV